MNFLDRFSKNTHIKFYDDQSSGSHVVPCGRTDGQTERRDEANSYFSQLYDDASNPIARGVPASDARTSYEGQSSSVREGERVNCAAPCRNFFPIRFCYR